MTVNGFRSDCHFSPWYAGLRVADELGGRLGLGKLSYSAHIKKDKWIIEYLARDLAPVLKEYARDNGRGEYQPDAPIWVCWWTGEETAPPLVRQCIASIRKHAGTHPVHLITENNYADYLDIPECLMEKVRSKTMCLANFSDYLRFSLLAKYGGLWLDATIYCAREIPEDYFRMPVFTCKGRNGDGNYISDYRWTSFCFGGWKNQVLFRFMHSAFEAYWTGNPVAIDYLLVDYLINLGYTKVTAIAAALDDVPENNLARDDLQAAMNAALPADQFDSVIADDTVFYKLSWREIYDEEAIDGQDSIYKYFLCRTN